MSQQGDLTESAPPGFSSDEVMRKAGSENFAVATRLIPRRFRGHLLAMYGYARFVDDIGDLSEGDRMAQLDWAEKEIERAFRGESDHPIFQRVGSSARALGMEIAPFQHLIMANRQDQMAVQYATYSDLEHYCDLSANPVGRMVLAIFEVSGDLECRLSDDACTALQILEHLQDVREDFAVGRVYVPVEDRERFGVANEDFGAATASSSMKALLAFETDRAEGLLQRSLPLVGLIHGWARVAISGFIGGGLAQVDALRRSDFEVFAASVKATKTAVARRTFDVYVHAGGNGQARRRVGGETRDERR